MTRHTSRRAFLAAAAGAGTLTVGANVGALTRQPETIRLAITKEGWVGQAPAEIEGQTNPTLQLQPGQTYRVRWTNRTRRRQNFALMSQYPDGPPVLRSAFLSKRGATQTVTFTAKREMTAYVSETQLNAVGQVVVGQGTPGGTPTGSPESTPRDLTDVPNVAETYQLVGIFTGWVGQAPESIAGKINPTLPVEPGRTYEVRWLNGDGAPHNFMIETDGDEQLVRSDVVATEGARQTVRFVASDRMWEYYCQIHPLAMRGDMRLPGEATTPGTGTPTETEESGIGPAGSPTVQTPFTETTTATNATGTTTDGTDTPTDGG